MKLKYQIEKRLRKMFLKKSNSVNGKTFRSGYYRKLYDYDYFRLFNRIAFVLFNNQPKMCDFSQINEIFSDHERFLTFVVYKRQKKWILNHRNKLENNSN